MTIEQVPKDYPEDKDPRPPTKTKWEEFTSHSTPVNSFVLVGIVVTVILIVAFG